MGGKGSFRPYSRCPAAPFPPYRAHLGDVLPVDADAAAPHVVEAEEQADDGALPRARGSHLRSKDLGDTRDPPPTAAGCEGLGEEGLSRFRASPSPPSPRHLLAPNPRVLLSPGPGSAQASRRRRRPAGFPSWEREQSSGPPPVPNIPVPDPIAGFTPALPSAPVPVHVAEVHVLKLDAPGLQAQVSGVHRVLHLPGRAPRPQHRPQHPGPCRGAGSGCSPLTSCSSWKSSNMFSMSTKEFWIILERGQRTEGRFGGLAMRRALPGRGQHYL